MAQIAGIGVHHDVVRVGTLVDLRLHLNRDVVLIVVVHFQLTGECGQEARPRGDEEGRFRYPDDGSLEAVLERALDGCLGVNVELQVAFHAQGTVHVESRLEIEVSEGRNENLRGDGNACLGFATDLPIVVDFMFAAPVPLLLEGVELHVEVCRFTIMAYATRHSTSACGRCLIFVDASTALEDVALQVVCEALVLTLHACACRCSGHVLHRAVETAWQEWAALRRTEFVAHDGHEACRR